VASATRADLHDVLVAVIADDEPALVGIIADPELV